MRNERVRISIAEESGASHGLLEIQKLRYQVYVEELKIQLPGSDHARRMLADSLDFPAIHLSALMQSRLVGAVRLNVGVVPAGVEEALQAANLPKPFVYCSRLNVLDAFRGMGAMQALAGACFEEFDRLNAEVAICHCLPHLFKLYERMGFQAYGSAFPIPGLAELGPQTPFRCVLKERRARKAA